MDCEENAKAVSDRLQTVTVVDAAQELLQQRILSGQIPPAERIRESPLAASLGISRHTLRAALSRLGSVGLLRFRENRGWMVPVFEQEEYGDILVLREALETAAYRAILRKEVLPEKEVDAALQRLVALDESVSWPDRIAADAALHQALVDLAGSERLSQAFATMLFEFRLCRLQSLKWLEQLGLDAWKELHVNLVNAIRARDSKLIAYHSSHHVNDPWRSPRLQND